MKNNNNEKIIFEHTTTIIYGDKRYTVTIRKEITPEQLPYINEIIQETLKEIERNIKTGIDNIYNIIENIEQKNNVTINLN